MVKCAGKEVTLELFGIISCLRSFLRQASLFKVIVSNSVEISGVREESLCTVQYFVEEAFQSRARIHGFQASLVYD